jgi:HAMP domain-containing protein
VEESRAEVGALAATVTEMRDTIKSLTAENGRLRNQLQTARKELGELTRVAKGTPARRKGEEATRATATRFFFDSRMRGRVYLVLSCFYFFSFVFCLCRLQAEEQLATAGRR